MNIFRPPGSSTLPRFRPVNRGRRIRAVTIALAAFTAIGTAAWTFGVQSETDFSTACEREDYVPATPDAIAINVYNGTQHIGLAATVAEQLADRGFTIGEIGNDPIRRKIRGTGELRFGPRAETTNLIDALRSWQPGMTKVKDTRRKGPEVDFVLGTKFDKLTEVAEPPPGTPQTACKADDTSDAEQSGTDGSGTDESGTDGS